MPTAYLGLGGNVGDARQYLNGAIEKIGDSEAISVRRVSKFYRTTPIGGPSGQSDYINAVIAVDTSLTPQDLLDHCLLIEKYFERTREMRWGPRTVDIDLLLFDRLVIVKPSLTVPHPELRNRLFVLTPLNDVAALDLRMPPDNAQFADVYETALNDPDIYNQGSVTAI